jgi:hypothetical protein
MSATTLPYPNIDEFLILSSSTDTEEEDNNNNEQQTIIVLIPKINSKGFLEWTTATTTTNIIIQHKIQMMGPMLKDIQRNQAYKNAIQYQLDLLLHEQNQPKSPIFLLDIGAGTGLLSLFSLSYSKQQNIKIQVFAVEMNPILASITQQNFIANGFNDNETLVIPQRSNEIQSSIHFNLIITETLDSELLMEGLFDSLLDANQRCSTPLTRYIPCFVASYGELVRIHHHELVQVVHRSNSTSLLANGNNEEQEAEYEFIPLQNGITIHGKTFLDKHYIEIISKPFELYQVTFTHDSLNTYARDENLCHVEKIVPLSSILTQPEKFNLLNCGILTFWNCNLSTSESTQLSTDPTATTTTTGQNSFHFQDHWFNNLYPVLCSSGVSDSSKDISDNVTNKNLICTSNLHTGKVIFQCFNTTTTTTATSTSSSSEKYVPVPKRNRLEETTVSSDNNNNNNDILSCNQFLKSSLSVWSNPYKHRQVMIWNEILLQYLKNEQLNLNTTTILDISDGIMGFYPPSIKLLCDIRWIKCSTNPLLENIIMDDDDKIALPNSQFFDSDDDLDVNSSVNVLEDMNPCKPQQVIVVCNPASLLDGNVWELDCLLILMKRIHVLFSGNNSIIQIFPQRARIMCHLVEFYDLENPIVGMDHVEGFHHEAFGNGLVTTTCALRYSYVLENYQYQVIGNGGGPPSCVGEIDFLTLVQGGKSRDESVKHYLERVMRKEITLQRNITRTTPTTTNSACTVNGASSVAVIFWVSWSNDGISFLENQSPGLFRPVEVRFVSSSMHNFQSSVVVHPIVGDRFDFGIDVVVD